MAAPDMATPHWPKKAAALPWGLVRVPRRTQMFGFAVNAFAPTPRPQTPSPQIPDCLSNTCLRNSKRSNYTYCLASACLLDYTELFVERMPT